MEPRGYIKVVSFYLRHSLGGYMVGTTVGFRDKTVVA
jgi:hypothetical protein